MACDVIYDFVSGARIQLPTVTGAAADVEADGRHGVRAILSPDRNARALISDHLRLLSEMSRAASAS